MDGLALILILVALSPVLSVIALIQTSSARRSIAALQARLAEVMDELRTLQTQVAGSRPAPPEAPPAEPVRSEPAPSEPPRAEAIGSEPAPSEQPAPVESAPAPEGPPTAAPQAPAAPAPAVPATVTLEEQLGTRWAVWVGGAALALGGVLLVRYTIEQGMFGPGVRVGLGGVFSLILVAAGEWFRRSERASPVEGIPTAHIPGILTAAGTISAFGTVYAAHALYGFIGSAAAFILLGGIGIATMLAAALHGPALAGLGLAGALVEPLLITSQQPNPWPVVLYLGVVAGAAYALARLRRWLWLAAAAVAGTVLWGFAFLHLVNIGAASASPASLFVHIGLQLALAAAFMAIEPHLTTSDADAEPDWIATLALAAFAVLAIRALDATRLHEQWTVFAAVALAILGVTAWRSAPAAGAAALAGIVALGAIAVWPGLALPPGSRLPSPLVENALRVPENVANFLAFAGLSTLSVGVLATLRLRRGRTLPLTASGLYALAAVVPPLLALCWRTCVSPNSTARSRSH